METHAALMTRAFDTLTRDGVDAAATLLTDDFIAHLPGLTAPLHGRSAWAAGVRQMLTAFPDLRITVQDTITQDNRIAVRLSFEGTHTGPFQGIPATHRPVSFTSIEIYRIAPPLIAEEWVSPDMLTLMRQIS